MVEPTTASGGDDLRFAQLACAKLAGLAQGALSVGVPALVTHVPEPRTFLRGRFRTLASFADVLHAVGGPPGDSQAGLRLREKAGRLSVLLEELQSRLLVALDAADPTAVLGPSRATALAFFDALGEYADLVRLDRAPIRKAQVVVRETFDGTTHLAPCPAAAAE